eukprot:7966879-Karenia_brevis.AAC.1
MVHDFYHQLYSDSVEDSHLPSWVHQNFSRSSLKELPQIDGHLVRTLITRLADGKTCSQEDMVVAEMLKALPDEVTDMLAEIFILRLLNHPSESGDDIWDMHWVTLLAKVPGASK